MEAESQVQSCSALTGTDQVVDLLSYDSGNLHYMHTELPHFSVNFAASF